MYYLYIPQFGRAGDERPDQAFGFGTTRMNVDMVAGFDGFERLVRRCR